MIIYREDSLVERLSAQGPFKERQLYNYISVLKGNEDSYGVNYIHFLSKYCKSLQKKYAARQVQHISFQFQAPTF